MTAKNKGNCRSCGKPIIWVKLKGENGKPHPCDPRQRAIQIVTLAGDVVRGYESHFATCKNAAEHRRG